MLRPQTHPANLAVESFRNFPSPWLGSVLELPLPGDDKYYSSEVVELEQLSR